MAKRICWKKGMRLTDDILRKSDNCTIELVGNALVLAAAGRFGLLPSTSPFDLSMNINKGIVDVDRLSCSAVTKDGSLIDAHYDTTFTNTFDTRVQIPEGSGEKEFLLTIDAHPEQWKDTNNEYEEPVYSFSLIAINSPLPANSLPIAHIVDEYGWRIDDVDFVPPCLYISSHHKYIELKKQFEEVLTAIDAKARNLLHSNGKEAIRIFWPVVQQLMITINKECDLMTPMELLANVQKCVSAFTCACELDEYLNLADAENFRNYIYVPYNYRDAYQRIKEGLELCFSINAKIDVIGNERPRTMDVPIINSQDLTQECSTNDVSIPVVFSSRSAKLYYTTDGSNPTEMTLKASNTKDGYRINFKNDFKPIGEEPDKNVIIKIIAIENGEVSPIASYEITLKKSLSFRKVKRI